jgi:hypothetical protein
MDCPTYIPNPEVAGSNPAARTSNQNVKPRTAKKKLPPGLLKSLALKHLPVRHPDRGQDTGVDAVDSIGHFIDDMRLRPAAGVENAVPPVAVHNFPPARIASRKIVGTPNQSGFALLLESPTLGVHSGVDEDRSIGLVKQAELLEEPTYGFRASFRRMSRTEALRRRR